VSTERRVFIGFDGLRLELGTEKEEVESGGGGGVDGGLKEEGFDAAFHDGKG
jgi:hypothetical protein